MKNWNKKKLLNVLTTFVILTLLLGIGAILFEKFVSPKNISFPVSDHLHFRMQIVSGGRNLNFADDSFQEPYIPGSCQSDLTTTPIHFHDNFDQVNHIHWSNITGGQVLKYYGLNKIGGFNDFLGWNFEKLIKLKGFPEKISTKENAILGANKNSKIWIYSGDALPGGKVTFQERNEVEFLTEDLEKFFGKESLIKIQRRDVEEENKKNKVSFVRLFSSINAHAHGGVDDGDNDIDNRIIAQTPESNNSNSNQSEKSSRDVDPNADKNKERLEKINNLIGNVVIFIQDQKPDNDTVKEKFSNLTPLKDSTCGG